MKKLLVLVLVLSMASMAQAAITFTFGATEIAVGESTTILISSTTQLLEGGYYAGVGLASAGDASLNVDAASVLYGGSSVSVFMVDDGGDGTAESLGIRNPFVGSILTDPVLPPANPKPVIGDLLGGIGITGLTAGIVTINFIDGGTGETIGSADITVTPEPITVGLLGLGALFLRRRK
jgi:hypothetical protein